MNEKDNVTEQLKELITVYEFNKNALSQYLELSINDVENLAQGNIDFLPNEPTYRFRLFNKIAFLYASATEDKDLKLSAFLQVLISYHGLSQKTIAKMADVETSDIERILSNSSQKMSEEAKYKIAVTVMALRFFLKDCEPTL
jgi:predicted XRE-type DNA-binding protein